MFVSNSNQILFLLTLTQKIFSIPYISKFYKYAKISLKLRKPESKMLSITLIKQGQRKSFSG